MEDSFQVFKYSSFSRKHHVYKDVCIPIIGDDSLTRDLEEHNENDKNALSIVLDDCVSKKIVGYVALKWSKVASKFLQFTNHHTRAEVTRKRVNHGYWIGTQNTCQLFFMEMQELY